MYEEAPARTPGAVRWWREASGSVRVLPDGCMDLLWTDGSLVVVGPDSAAVIADARAGATFSAVRFAPGVGPALFGLPAVELRDQRVPLDAVWSATDVRRFQEQVDTVAGPEERAAVLDAIAEERIRSATSTSIGEMPTIARWLGAGVSVVDVARRTGWSERQFRRRSLDAFGYGPKRLARILRLGQALDLARVGVAPAAVAARSGYADQPHFAREVRALAGVTLRELLAEPSG